MKEELITAILQMENERVNNQMSGFLTGFEHPNFKTLYDRVIFLAKNHLSESPKHGLDFGYICAGAGQCDHDGTECGQNDNCGEYEPITVQPPKHETVEGMKRKIDNLYEKALDAITHVAMANYAHREREAIKWVRDAYHGKPEEE